MVAPHAHLTVMTTGATTVAGVLATSAAWPASMARVCQSWQLCAVYPHPHAHRTRIPYGAMPIKINSARSFKIDRSLINGRATAGRPIGGRP
jgi:hypothetical protein